MHKLDSGIAQAIRPRFNPKAIHVCYEAARGQISLREFWFSLVDFNSTIAPYAFMFQPRVT